MKIRPAVLLIPLLALSGTGTMAWAEEAYPKVQPLLSTSRSVLEEPLVWPDGSPMQITSTIITINPGEETSWHQHGVPLYVYILSGEVTVDYQEHGTRTFGPGQAFMEAMRHWHRGTNQGKEPVRILAVYLGSSHGTNVIPRQ